MSPLILIKSFDHKIKTIDGSLVLTDMTSDIYILWTNRRNPQDKS